MRGKSRSHQRRAKAQRALLGALRTSAPVARGTARRKTGSAMPLHWWPPAGQPGHGCRRKPATCPNRSTACSSKQQSALRAPVPHRHRVWRAPDHQRHRQWAKTELYLRLIDDVLTRGRQALVLIPEIALTPQLEQHFHRRFPGRHIASSQWIGRSRTGRKLARRVWCDILLGTRFVRLFCAAATTRLDRGG